METVKLRNGSEEAKAVVITAMLSLENLFKTKPIVFYELVMKCRDPKHKLFSEAVTNELKRLALLEERGTVHDSVRNVVLSATKGEGLALSLGSPIG